MKKENKEEKGKKRNSKQKKRKEGEKTLTWAAAGSPAQVARMRAGIVLAVSEI
jgi:hypothetical protein